jgi:hypothetical protein
VAGVVTVIAEAVAETADVIVAVARVREVRMMTESNRC